MKNKLSLLLSSLLAGILLLTGTARAAGDCTTIDVLSAFDQSSQKSLRTSVEVSGVTCAPMSEEQTAEIAIAQLNQILVRSGIGDKVQFRNVGVFKANYHTIARPNGQGGLGGDLTAIFNNQIPGLLDARAEHKADLVILYTDYPFSGSGVVGTASPVELASSITRLVSVDKPGGYAATFHVSTIRVNDSTFAHEVCHLMGAGHADYQLAQCGPQLIASASGSCTEDKQFCSLMSYNFWQDVNDDNALSKPYRSATAVQVLSGPKPIPYTDPKTGKKLTLQLGNEDTQNNASVVAGTAPYVASFQISGKETPNNDSWENAFPLPKLSSGNETIRRMLKSFFYWHFDKIVAIVANSTGEKHNNEFKAKCWEVREELLNSFIEEKHKDFIYPELLEADGQDSYISSIYGSTCGASRQHGEPSLPGGCGNTVWYKVIIPEDGDLEVGIRKIFTTNDFTPVLGVFYGDQIGKLTQLEQQDVQNEKSSYFLKNIKVNVPKGAKLYIAVDSQKQGNARFNLLARLYPGKYNGKPIQTGDDDDDDSSPPPVQPAGSSSPILLILCLGLGVVCIVLTIMLIYQMKSMAKENQASESPYAPAPASSYPPAPTPGYAPVPDNTPCNFPACENIPGPAPIPGYDAPAPIPGVEVEPPTAPRPMIVLSGILSDGRKVKYKITVAEISRHHNFYIGRDPKKSHFCIDDMSISGRHAVFKMRSEENRKVLLLGDAGSRNGTSVNGSRMTGGLCAKIHNNAKIQLGQCVFTLTTKTE